MYQIKLIMKTERQQEIIDVALKLINNKGIQGLTMKYRSRDIGISEPAIYRHFETQKHPSLPRRPYNGTVPLKK